MQRGQGQHPSVQTSLADVCAACKRTSAALLEASKAPGSYTNERLKLAKCVKRLQPLLDDLETQGYSPSTVPAAETAIQVLTAGMQRAIEIMGTCTSVGPFFALFNDLGLSAEFVNCAIDMARGLSQIDCKALGQEDIMEDLQRVQNQLNKSVMDYDASTKRTSLLHDLRVEAEALRSGVAPKQAPAAPAQERVEEMMSHFVYQQLQNDMTLLTQLADQANEERKWVDAFFYKYLVNMLAPLVPKDRKSARAMASQPVMVSPTKSAISELEEPPQAASTDPVIQVHSLLKRLSHPKLKLEQRLDVLQPLMAAAGLADPVPGSYLHSGAVLFALTDQECAQEVVALLNSSTTDPEIKLYLLGLVLSLVNPETGLNTDSQQALMETGLPRTLCRLVVVSTTPADQKLQALAMLRVFVADPSSHTLLVEAKVIHTIVGQVGAVAVVKGKVLNKATSSPTKALSPDGKPVEAVWNAEQHMVELSVLMLADLGRVFKVEVMKAGGVPALVQRMEDSQSHERVRVAAAGALAYLMEDGAIALEVAKANGLVGLVDMMRSPSLAMSESARNAVKVMLTPSPPTSAPSNATPAAADAAPSKSDVDQMVDLMIEMGKGFSPAAVNCLMDVIASGDKELRPLAMALLPLTATDPLCRRTIMSHAMGGPELFRAAGQGDMSAVDTLRRVAGDSTLRQAVAAELAKAFVAEREHPEAMVSLAHAIAGISSPPAGLERDNKAASAAAKFSREIVESGGVPQLVGLAKSGDPKMRIAGVLALRPMCVYGDEFTRAALVEADAIMTLAECTKDAPHRPEQKDSLSVAACEALQGLCFDADSRKRVFGGLMAYLNSADAGSACHALMVVAGQSTENFTVIISGGTVPKVVELVLRGNPNALGAPCQLLCALCKASSVAADQAVGVSKSGEGAKHGVPFGTAAVTRAMSEGDVDAKVAAMGASGFMARRAELARTQLAEMNMVNLALDIARGAPLETPWWEEAMASISSMATMHPASRTEVTKALKLMMVRGTPLEMSAAATATTYMAAGPKGREIVFSDEMVEPLVMVLEKGLPRGQAAAADALGHLSLPATVALTPVPGEALAEHKKINTRAHIVARGAVPLLIALLWHKTELCVFEAAETLDLLAASQEGVKAIRSNGGVEALLEVVARGRKRELTPRTVSVAQAAHLKCSGLTG